MKYLAYARCEIIYFVNREIESFAFCEIKFAFSYCIAIFHSKAISLAVGKCLFDRFESLVFMYQTKKDHPTDSLFCLAKQNDLDAHIKKLCVSKATLTFSLFTITYYFPKIDKPF